MDLLDDLNKELDSLGNPRMAEHLKGFFKTGKGQYGEGDVFIGIKVPVLRKVAIRYMDLSFSDIAVLIRNPVHERRMVALFLLIEMFRKADTLLKKKIFDLYLSNTRYINNWDLVDLSTWEIIGTYLLDKDRKILRRLAKSSLLWDRRIAIVSTYAFIKNGESADTFAIAEILLHDKHDLIHKAVGWMLREAGKRAGLEGEKKFLRRYAGSMPRTMLRYAIEKFPQKERERFMRM